MEVSLVTKGRGIVIHEGNGHESLSGESWVRERSTNSKETRIMCYRQGTVPFGASAELLFQRENSRERAVYLL